MRFPKEVRPRGMGLPRQGGEKVDRKVYRRCAHLNLVIVYPGFEVLQWRIANNVCLRHVGTVKKMVSGIPGPT